jgi:hypothetical protein
VAADLLEQARAVVPAHEPVIDRLTIAGEHTDG